jgi:hypothetical protein
MVFAAGAERDSTQRDRIIVSTDFLECARKALYGALGVAGEPFTVGPEDASGSVDQAFAIRIIADPADECPYSVLCLCLPDPLAAVISA